jgi:hypothetical protein
MKHSNAHHPFPSFLLTAIAPDTSRPSVPRQASDRRTRTDAAGVARQGVPACVPGEYEWIENWKCEILYSESGYAEKNCVFVNSATGETWILTRLEPENYVFEAAIFATHAVVKVELSLVPTAGGTCTARGTFTATATTRVGNRFIGDSARDRLRHRLRKLFQQLEHYLLTARCSARGTNERRAMPSPSLPGRRPRGGARLLRHRRPAGANRRARLAGYRASCDPPRRSNPLIEKWTKGELHARPHDPPPS